MRSRDRAVRALLLACVVALGVVPWGTARADLGSSADRSSDATPSRSVPLSAIHDDPDIIPTAALAPVDPARHAPRPSRHENWRLRLSMILSAITGAPWLALAPPPAAWME